MDRRPDGRMYSRVTRRGRAILEAMESMKPYHISEIVSRALAHRPIEFYLARFDAPMSDGRVRVYIRYLVEIGAINSDESSLIRTFRLRQTDEQWAQALSDATRPHLARFLETSPAQVPSVLGEKCQDILSTGRPPTVPALISALSIGGGREEEFFRWSLYLLSDGSQSRVEIRRYPTIWVG